MRALITGGTAGLGAAFARALAERGDDLVLVARDAERLASFADELRGHYGIVVDVLRADLSVEEDLLAVAAVVEDPDRPIDLLVNNAGFGLHRKLSDADVKEHRYALDVMCYAVLVLGGAAARAMRTRGHGHIINMSSIASLTAQGHYSAIKVWVRAYSESLAVELRGTGVGVTVACPGWVHTEFHERAGIRTGAIPSWVWQDADAVARCVLADAERGRMISVPGIGWKIARVALKLAPSAAVRTVSQALVRSRG